MRGCVGASRPDPRVPTRAPSLRSCLLRIPSRRDAGPFPSTVPTSRTTRRPAKLAGRCRKGRPVVASSRGVVARSDWSRVVRHPPRRRRSVAEGAALESTTRTPAPRCARRQFASCGATAAAREPEPMVDCSPGATPETGLLTSPHTHAASAVAMLVGGMHRAVPSGARPSGCRPRSRRRAIDLVIARTPPRAIGAKGVDLKEPSSARRRKLRGLGAPDADTRSRRLYAFLARRATTRWAPERHDELGPGSAPTGLRLVARSRYMRPCALPRNAHVPRLLRAQRPNRSPRSDGHSRLSHSAFVNPGWFSSEDFSGSRSRVRTARNQTPKLCAPGASTLISSGGHTTRHQTFVEMMGNFSVGDTSSEKPSL